MYKVRFGQKLPGIRVEETKSLDSVVYGGFVEYFNCKRESLDAFVEQVSNDALHDGLSCLFWITSGSPVSICGGYVVK
jgi:hypothetical protein